MVTKQIRFRCIGEDNYNGGILVDDGKEVVIICGCCGGIIENEDIEDFCPYDEWVNISNEIMGE